MQNTFMNYLHRHGVLFFKTFDHISPHTLSNGMTIETEYAEDITLYRRKLNKCVDHKKIRIGRRSWPVAYQKEMYEALFANDKYLWKLKNKSKLERIVDWLKEGRYNVTFFIPEKAVYKLKYNPISDIFDVSFSRREGHIFFYDSSIPFITMFSGHVDNKKGITLNQLRLNKDINVIYKLIFENNYDNRRKMQ